MRALPNAPLPIPVSVCTACLSAPLWYLPMRSRSTTYSVPGFAGDDELVGMRPRLVGRSTGPLEPRSASSEFRCASLNGVK